MTRRAVGLGLGLAPVAAAGVAQATARPTRSFRFAVLADPHFTDRFSQPAATFDDDVQSLPFANDRAAAAVKAINRLTPACDLAFVVGDIVHDLPSADPAFYRSNTTRFDSAEATLKTFSCPVYVGFGNHDYGTPDIPSSISHELFKGHFSADPYYAVDHRGWRFLMLNPCLGATWDPKSRYFRKDYGSLGRAQLEWLAAKLEDGLPSFLFIHYPLTYVRDDEFPDLDLLSLVRKHRATIARVFAGHWHKWVDFGQTYGAPHTVIASTRYDANAFLVVEAAVDRRAHRLLNADRVDWGTHFARPFTG